MTRQYQAGDEPVPGYRLEMLIGRGQFSLVWKAAGPDGAPLALKILPIDAREAYRKSRRLRQLCHIQHPNLVPILGVWLRDSQGQIVDDSEGDPGYRLGANAQLVIASPLADRSLANRLQDYLSGGQPGLPLEELLACLEQAARGIDHLNQPQHDLGSGPMALPHCNIKPSNLLVFDDSVRVGDLGLATIWGGTRLHTGILPYYQAPELFVHNKPTLGTDQYSLAITYVQLRTGALPFQAESPAGIVAAHVRGMLDLSRLPEAERSVIRRATAVDPGQRFARASDLVRAIRQTIPAASPSNPQRQAPQLPKGDASAVVMEKGLEVVPGYKLIRLLGRGGYGEVWEASAPGNLRIALKIVKNLEANTGRQEFKSLQIIKNLNHGHLLGLHAYWLLDTQGQIIPDELVGTPEAPQAALLVLASRLADKNLMQRLKECQKEGQAGIPSAELIEYMHQSASAIDYLNKVSIQHRDIKPENILIAGEIAIVGDFGLAKVLEGTNAQINSDSLGMTLLYAAPEMFSGTISRWSDQYSLAITYYYMRTGKPPFTDLSPYSVIQAHLGGHLEFGLLPAPEQPILKKATAFDPPSRWPSCVLMVKELAKVLVTSSSTAVVAAGGPPPSDTDAGSGVQVPDQPVQVKGHEIETLNVQNLPLPDTKDSEKLAARLVKSPSTAVKQAPRTATELTAQEPTKREQRPKRPRPGVKIALALGLLLAIGIGIWLGLWALVQPGGPTRGDILQLVVEEQFAQAMDKIDECRLDEATKTGLRDRVRDNWLKAVEMDFTLGRDDRVDERSAQLLERFPNHPPALDVRRKSLDRSLPPAVQQKLDAEQFAAASALVAKPAYDSPVRSKLEADVRQAWLEAARRQLRATQPARALAILQEMLQAFPEDAEALAEERTAKREIARQEILRLVQGEQYVKASEVLAGNKELFGPTTEDFSRLLVENWMAAVRNAKERPRQVELANQLWAYNQGDQVKKLLAELKIVPLNPAAQAELTRKIGQAESMLAATPAQALQLADEGLRHEYLEQLPALRSRALLVKARAQARAKDWKGLPQTLAQLPGNLSDPDRTAVLLLRLLVDETSNPDPFALLKPLAELRQAEAELKKLDSWEQAQYQQVRSRVLDGVVLQARSAPAAEALGRLEQLLQSVPDHLPALVLKADLLQRGQDLKGCQAILVQVQKALKQPGVTADAQLKADVNALTALVGVRPEAAAQERAEAVKQLQQLLNSPNPPRQLALAEALGGAARNDPSLRPGAAAVIRKALDRTTAPAERQRLSDLLGVLFQEIMAQADWQLQDRQYSSVAGLLAEAEALAAEAAARQEIDALRAIAWVAQPGTPKEQDQALELIKVLVKQPAPPRVLELGQALVRLAQSQDRFIPDARAALADLVNNVAPSPVQQQLQRELRELSSLDLRKRLIPGDKPPNWTEIEQYCLQAELTGWVRLALAESQLERNLKLKPADRTALDALKADGELGAYAAYVQGLAYRADGQAHQAAERIVDAFPQGPAPAVLTGFRRQRALGLLRAVIDQVLKDENYEARLARNPLQVPFPPAAADRLVRYLPKARQLQVAAGQPPGLDLQALHALALAYQSQPNMTEALREADVLLARSRDKLGKSLPALLYLQAKEQPGSEPGKRVALEAYGQLADELRPHAEKDDALGGDLDRLVVAPALKLAQDWPAAQTDPALARRLARLYGHKGARLLLEARKLPPAERLDSLQRSVLSYQEGVKVGRKRLEGEELAGLLSDWSWAQLELADALPPVPVKPRRELFDRVLKSADEATLIAPRSNPELAWRAFGTAFEELALLGEQPAVTFPKAKKAFDQAVQEGQKGQPDSLGKAYLDRGRCIYRSVLAAAVPADELTRSAEDLQLALKLIDRQASPAHRVQALWWLSMVQLARHHHPSALQTIDVAFLEAKAHDFPDLPRFVLDWAKAALDEGLRTRAKDPKQADLLFQSVQRSTDNLYQDLKKQKRPADEPLRVEAAAYLGHVQEQLGAGLKAMAVFREVVDSKGLDDLEKKQGDLEKQPADQRVPLAPAYFRLLFNRGEWYIRNMNSKELPRDLQGSVIVEAARRDLALAVRLSKTDATISDWDRLRAAGSSGIAHDLLAAATPAYRTIARDHLEDARKLDTSKDGYTDRWLWCFLLAKQYLRQADSAKAQERLDEALKLAPPPIKPKVPLTIEALRKSL